MQELLRSERDRRCFVLALLTIRHILHIPRLPCPYRFVSAPLTRFFLGFIEAAFFPGAFFLLSKWYKRSELGTCIALLYCGTIISDAFGALIASGILDDMNG